VTKLSACVRSSGERNPKVDPKIELFRTCIAAIPRYNRAEEVVLKHFVLNVLHFLYGSKCISHFWYPKSPAISLEEVKGKQT